jgi:hypothetical protein
MRIVPRVLLVFLLVIAVLLPTTALSDQLPFKLERAIYPGRTNISYVGQNFVFDTTETIYITIISLSDNKIKLSVKVVTPHDPQGNQTQSERMLCIDWVNWDDQLYNGPPPGGPWGIILDTESGYTEK